ncbi:MAG: hypothetical protein LBB67_07195 [Oscillospiraceae bacterium]|nr:hypothetical protein [Oscillospiraceae bacterium]
MDTHDLIVALQGLHAKEYDWTFALYSTHKSRDGLQLSWNACAMDGIAMWVDQLIRPLLEKTLNERTVAEYSPLLPKEEIGALESGNELIRDPLQDMLQGIPSAEKHAPEDFANGVVAKPAGYAFYGTCTFTEPAEHEDEEPKQVTKRVVFLRRSNPFIGGAKTLLCAAKGDTIVESDTPLLKFAMQTDFLLIDDICYFLNDSIAKEFDLESREFAVCNRRLEQITEADVVGDLEQFQLAALSGKNPRKFLDFDREILEHIAGLSVESRIDFLAKYGVELDADGKMNTADAEQCELIIDLLCGRSCLDALGRLAVGINIKPRE